MFQAVGVEIVAILHVIRLRMEHVASARITKKQG